MQSIDAILGGLRQLTTPYPTSFLAQRHEPHASLAAEERQAALGLLRAGAVEIGNADVVGLDDHAQPAAVGRSEEHTSELQSLMRISYAVFCLKKKNRHIISMTHRLYLTIR